MTTGPTRGRCLCGDVRYEYDGAPITVVHCHCESCRRHTASPMTTFVVVDRAHFRFTSKAPAAYESSPGVTRTHCGRCGTPIHYETVKRPQMIELYAATLEEAAALTPKAHIYAAEQLPWIETTDGLPRYAGSSLSSPILRHGPRS